MSEALQKLFPERWQKLTLVEQLANIGSEVHRVAKWHNQGDLQSEEKATERVLELVDLTLMDICEENRLRELTRLREVFLDVFRGKQEYQVSPEMLDSYFLPFALAARK